MTHLLEEAMSAVAKLPDQDQDALAAILLEEIASEKRWEKLFAQSQSALAKLAADALDEKVAGRTRPM